MPNPILIWSAAKAGVTAVASPAAANFKTALLFSE
jgi:hypothetical protein